MPTSRCVLRITPPANDANLRSEAVEAMNVLLKNSARDTIEVVRSTLQVVLSHLEQSFSSQILTAEDREKVQGLQSLLCGSLQVRDLSGETFSGFPQERRGC